MPSLITTLDVLSEDYPDKSIDQNQAQLTNMYLEPGQVRSKGKYKLVAYPMPGLTLFGNTGQANVRDIMEYNGVLYVVSGNKFGSMASNGTFTQLGSNLSTSSGFVKMRAIAGGNNVNNQIQIIDGTAGYAYNVDTAVATFPITDIDYPQTGTDLTSQDDYTLVVNNNSIAFNISNLSDTTGWDALDFASKISFPDNLVGIESYKKRIWLFGSRTTEIWYNSGNANFPFASVADVFLNYGLVSPLGKLVCNDVLYFFGQSRDGGYGFFKVDTNYVPSPISGTTQETVVNNFTTVTDCKAYAYKRDGHVFIDWVFPTENKTFTYDVTTGIWLRRKSYISSAYNRFLGNCSAFCYNKSLTGDYNSGKIYQQVNTVYEENSVSILRQCVTPPLYFDGRRVFIHRLQIDVETGVGDNKTFTLEMSTDSGRNWELIDTYTIPSDNTTQIYTSSLGSSYDFRFRISTTMNANFILLGMTARLSIGNN